MKAKKEKFYMISDTKIEEIKQNAEKEGIKKAFPLFLGFSVMVFSDHFRDLWYVKGKDKSRTERFTDYVLNWWEDYVAGDITLDECMKVVKEECGIDLVMEVNKKFL